MYKFLNMFYKILILLLVKMKWLERETRLKLTFSVNETSETKMVMELGLTLSF